jgi:hypothetical protein
MNQGIALPGGTATPAGRNTARRALPPLGGLAAALGYSLLAGCNPSTPGVNLFGSPVDGKTAQYMAIAANGTIQLYILPDSTTGVSGSAPMPVQTLSAPNVLSVAIDTGGDLLYLASDPVNPLDADFFICPAVGHSPDPTYVFPVTGTCEQVGGTIPGGQWLTTDGNAPGINGNPAVFATSLGATAGTVVSFAENVGPGPAMTTVYTSTVEPVYYGGLAVDVQDTVYVTEQNHEFGGDELFACSATCAQNPGSQTDVTASLLGQVPDAAAGGPLAIAQDGMTLYIGGANASTSSPATLAVSVFCLQPSPQRCFGNSVTFPLLDDGNFNPFVSSAGIAGDADGNTYNPVLLSDSGQTGADVGPMFYGLTNSGQFSCSGNQSACPVNLLPAPPIDTVRGSYSYGIAVGVSGNQYDVPSPSPSGG